MTEQQQENSCVRRRFLYFLSPRPATLFLPSCSSKPCLARLLREFLRSLNFRNPTNRQANLSNDRTTFLLQNAGVNGPMVCHDAADTNPEL